MKTFNKLIRDKIPEIIERDENSCIIRILDSSEFKNELLKKLVEEVTEAVEAREDKKELIKKIGDVMEVLDAIIIEFDIDKKEIKEVKKERKEKRGGFEKKIFLESTN